MPEQSLFSEPELKFTSFEAPPSPMAALQELAHQDEEGCWELLSGVFQNLNQGIIVADRSGRVLVFNPVAEEIMGYRAREVVGRLSLWDFCEQCARPPLFRESLLQGQSFPEEEVEMTSRKARNASVGVKVTPLYGKNGTLVGALAAIRSLDELRAQEQERKSLVRLASIGRIISAVAHEINNPLQTVRTSLELSFDPRKSEARRHEYLQAADQEIARIARVIGQMRNFYRPNPGEKRPTDVHATLHEAIGMLGKRLHKASVEVQLQLAPQLPPVSLIDYQLEQVFLNLILNAVEAMPEGGCLTITSHVEGRRVVVAFSDSAEQLDPRHAASVFDPFANTGRVGELALGLSVSREIITELGGSIEIHPNSGNTLLVRLPY